MIVHDVTTSMLRSTNTSLMLDNTAMKLSIIYYIIDKEKQWILAMLYIREIQIPLYLSIQFNNISYSIIDLYSYFITVLINVQYASTHHSFIIG